MKNFGQVIREKREAQELKVYELAAKVGVNPVYITQIEKHNKLPSPEKAKAISDVLNDKSILKFYITDRKNKLAASATATVATLATRLYDSVKISKKKKRG